MVQRPGYASLKFDIGVSYGIPNAVPPSPSFIGQKKNTCADHKNENRASELLLVRKTTHPFVGDPAPSRFSGALLLLFVGSDVTLWHQYMYIMLCILCYIIFGSRDKYNNYIDCYINERGNRE